MKVYTTRQAAVLCGLSQQTIIRCFDSGKLGGFKVPGSRYRKIPRESLLKFMREYKIPTDSLSSTSEVDEPEPLESAA